MRATYHHGGYPDLDVDWGDPSNVDLTGYTIALTVFPFGGATAFTKTTGFTIPPLVAGAAPSPNLVVAWSTTPAAELDGLADGDYVMKFVGTKSAAPTLEMYGQLTIRMNAPNFGYCEKGDLLLGDLKVSSSINLYDYINSAADEIDAEVGQRYLIPLDLSKAASWVVTKLKDINAKLATGRLITALAMAGGLDMELQAYGAAMIKRAMDEVFEISGGKVLLAGVPIDPASFRVTSPIVVNYDQVSGVDAISTLIHRGQPRVPQPRPVWQPGNAPTTPVIP